MAKISDEIRKWCADLDSDDILCTTATLYTLADRIDRETVELPKDRDGKPIHIGDTVYAHGFPDGNGGATCEVCSIEFNEGRESSIEITTSGIVTYRTPSSLTHELPDSFERIADELVAWCDRVDVDGDACEKPRDIVERIRKLAKREDRQCQ